MERSIGINKLKSIIHALDRAAQKAGVKNVRIILCGGLAAIAYGLHERTTLDIDAEMDADFKIIEKFKKNLIFPAELTTNISRWSMIDIPKGYRKRAVPLDIIKAKNISVFLLSPLDLIISKLRVFRDKDIQDALFLIKEFRERPEGGPEGQKGHFPDFPDEKHDSNSLIFSNEVGFIKAGLVISFPCA
jgi:hypothetical protein